MTFISLNRFLFSLFFFSFLYQLVLPKLGKRNKGKEN